MKATQKAITVSLKTNKVAETKIKFTGDMFTVEEFTSLIMSMIEAYTKGLLATNSPEKVHAHWNRTFGILLKKLLPEDAIYKNSEEHKKAKELIEASIGAPSTMETARSTELNRIAAGQLAREILLEAGLEEHSVDVLLNKKLKLNEPAAKA